MTTAARNDLAAARDIAIDRLNWQRGYTNQLLEGIPDDQLTHRPGGKGNHAAWIMGHLAGADDFLTSTLTGAARTQTDKQKELFGGGSQPKDDPAAYPPRAELAEMMRTERARLIDAIRSLSDEQLRAEMPEDYRAFAPDAIAMIFTFLAHEGFHAGQVATIRASLGVPPLWG